MDGTMLQSGIEVGRKGYVGRSMRDQIACNLQRPAAFYFASIETSVVEPLTTNLDFSHVGGPRVTLTLFENP